MKGYLKWQDLAKILGPTASLIIVIIGILNLAGMNYTVPPDITCGTDCYSKIEVNSTYWEICVEHSNNSPIIYKKVESSRRLWINLDRIPDFIPTNPEVKVELMVPTISKYATIKNEFGYLRPVKDGDCIIKRTTISNPGPNKLIVHGSKEALQTVKWGFKLEHYLMQDIKIDPVWYGEEQRLRTDGFIGNFIPSNEIRIESQDYIDKYFDWNFTEINDTYWFANFTIDQIFWKDAKEAKELKDSKKICDKYFSDYLNCKDKEKTDKLFDDIINLDKYPLINLTSGIKFDKDTVNSSAGESFYIIFPEGFKVDERAKLGFDSTVINTGTNTPFYPYQRAICKDGAGNLHVVWRYSSTNVRYANSSDNGNTWSVNTTFYGGTSTSGSTKYQAHISCDGNNITVVYYDYTGTDTELAISTDNGATWSWKTLTYASLARDATPIVERRGQNIYLVLSTGIPLRFANSTDGGNTWPGTALNIMQSTTGYIIPSMVVDGNGSASDKIYVTGHDTTTKDIWFVNSTNSGITWGTKITLMTGTYNYPSITFNSSNLFVVVDNTSYDIHFTNSTNSGISWTALYRIDLLGTTANQAKNAIVTIDNNGYPRAFWEQNASNANYDIVYRSYNGTAWNDTVTYLTNNNFGNTFVNTPYRYYEDSKIHYIWRNGTASPYQIMYDYISLAVADNPPTFSNYNANTTVAGSPVNFSIVISDDVSLSGYIFETNNTGTWVNYTWTALASGGTAYNITTLNSIAGTRVNISFYANDSLNQWSVYRDGLTTTAADTCTYGGSGTWNIDCKDNCTNSGITVAGDLRIYSTGAGNVSITNINIQGDIYENYTHSCYVYWYGYRNITGGG